MRPFTLISSLLSVWAVNGLAVAVMPAAAGAQEADSLPPTPETVNSSPVPDPIALSSAKPIVLARSIAQPEIQAIAPEPVKPTTPSGITPSSITSSGIRPSGIRPSGIRPSGGTPLPQPPVASQKLSSEEWSSEELPTEKFLSEKLLLEKSSFEKSEVVAQAVDPTNPTRPEEEDLQPLDESDVRSELGDIQPLQPTQPAKPTPSPRKQPTVQLLLRSSAFTSSNITSLRDFAPSDTVFVNGAMLLATPKLGDSTRLIALAGGNLVRFANRGDSNYNSVNFNVAIQQRLAPGTYGQLGWVQEKLYRSDGGDRLLRDNSLQFILGNQSQIGKKLRLDTSYELRASFADPDDQSRLNHTLGARLRYDITPQLQGALDYRLSFKDYTQVDRFDTEHQVSAMAIYNLSRDVFVAGNVSYLFGRSSNSDNNPNNLSIGVSLGVNIPLF
ncbi:outer membrane beta-barrel protein [Alkalinema sp. FACHB-956]|uniref:outer membrane beta-barrel protein n=1 Tax=Alkalinema sp. FACHB-956 TaxID=2692768 RepID=UPI001F559FCF|nr:outer membrane beta-barrel protein [Alkalinema sp. FACHB-956]